MAEQVRISHVIIGSHSSDKNKVILTNGMELIVTGITATTEGNSITRVTIKADIFEIEPTIKQV